VLGLFEKGGLKTIDEFDERFCGTHCLFNWIQDLQDELWTASVQDRRFLSARIALCEEGLRRFGSAAGLTTENRRRALAESYFELGDVGKAEALFHEWLNSDPLWGWGWIGWSDCYRFTHTELKDWNRSEQILQEGLSIAGVRHRPDLLDRLAGLYAEQGRNEEANALWREAKRAAEPVRTTRTTSAVGNVLRQTTRFKFGGEGVPLDRLPELAAGLRGDSLPAPAKGHKTGRNEPCPCGSGKKFKKCCGA
jgi:tetratricopeptide (TPR) repeat protein